MDPEGQALLRQHSGTEADLDTTPELLHAILGLRAYAAAESGGGDGGDSDPEAAWREMMAAVEADEAGADGLAVPMPGDSDSDDGDDEFPELASTEAALDEVIARCLARAIEPHELPPLDRHLLLLSPNALARYLSEHALPYANAASAKRREEGEPTLRDWDSRPPPDVRRERRARERLARAASRRGREVAGEDQLRPSDLTMRAVGVQDRAQAGRKRPFVHLGDFIMDELDADDGGEGERQRQQQRAEEWEEQDRRMRGELLALPPGSAGTGELAPLGGDAVWDQLAARGAGSAGANEELPFIIALEGDVGGASARGGRSSDSAQFEDLEAEYIAQDEAWQGALDSFASKVAAFEKAGELDDDQLDALLAEAEAHTGNGAQMRALAGLGLAEDGIDGVSDDDDDDFEWADAEDDDLGEIDFGEEGQAQSGSADGVYIVTDRDEATRLLNEAMLDGGLAAHMPEGWRGEEGDELEMMPEEWSSPEADEKMRDRAEARADAAATAARDRRTALTYAHTEEIRPLARRVAVSASSFGRAQRAPPPALPCPALPRPVPPHPRVTAEHPANRTATRLALPLLTGMEPARHACGRHCFPRRRYFGRNRQVCRAPVLVPCRNRRPAGAAYGRGAATAAGRGQLAEHCAGAKCQWSP